MKIRELHVEGYRSFKKVSWKPGDLNVVIGPNASGKSNLLQILDLLHANANEDSYLEKHIQREGGIQSMIWDGIGDHIGLSLYNSSDLLDDEDLIKWDITLDALGGRNDYVRKCQIKLVDRNNKEVFTNLLEKNAENRVIIPSHEQSLKPDRTETIRGELVNFWKNISIHHSLSTDRDAPIRRPVVTRHEKQLDPDGQNLINVLHTLYTDNRIFKQNIDEAMSSAFGQEFEEIVFSPAADQYIQMRIRWSSLQCEQSAANLSDGTLRFLYLMVMLAHPHPAPLIAIDEPETGLHPRMFPIIAEFAREVSSKSQIIFTTHSSDFLHAFHESITTTVVEWNEGQTHLRVLSGEELTYWLKEYTLGELFRSGELEAMG